MKLFRSYFLVLIGCILCLSSPLAADVKQVVGFSFDIDNNILSLPTKIVVFKKGSGEAHELSTAELAEWRERKNNPDSKWKDYYISPGRGSFKYYRDQPGTNNFLNDIIRGQKETPLSWKGPVWDAFVKAMASPVTAHKTTLITARGHDPKSILEGLELLKSQGYIKHVPLLENIWPVAQPKFNQQFEGAFGQKPPPGAEDRPSKRKAAVMEFLLDSINSRKVARDAVSVLSPNGGRRGKYHTWGFSDDDYKNYREAKKVLQEGVNKGRWSRTKIVLYYTGTEHKTQKPHAIVLRKGQDPRPLTDEEEVEWKEILSKRRRARSMNSQAGTCEKAGSGVGLGVGAPNLFNAGL